MNEKRYYPGDKIPTNDNYKYYVIEDGHWVRSVTFKYEYEFPALDNPRQYYIASG